MPKSILSETPKSIDPNPSLFGQWSTLRAAALGLAMCASAALTLSAQTVTTIHTFNGADGSSQISPLIQNTDGNFYGTTEGGGTDNSGTIFKITPQGTLTTLYSFCDAVPGCSRVPFAALVRGTNGNLYGTAAFGGSDIDCNGAVFQITPRGAFTTLYEFCSSESSGQFPEAALVQAQDGNLYGITSGTLFKISPQGQLTTIYRFCSQPSCTDGSFPTGPGLLLGADGNLYGTTSQGGAFGLGTVFRSTLTGKLTTLYSFCAQSNCPDGRGPGPIVQASDGNLYGTSVEGGSTGNECNDPTGCGTAFKLTWGGKLTTLYTFCYVLFCKDGYTPNSLVVGSDGNLYGTTRFGGILGGNYGDGTIFRLTPDGTFTSLYAFCTQAHCPDGAWPTNLVQSTDGTFYGATNSSNGTIFKLDVGLPPFLKTMPRFGKVGASVIVLGNRLSSATTVSINGTAATFTVLSNNEIKATVPAGATTGQLTVTTAQATLASDVVFTVVP